MAGPIFGWIDMYSASADPIPPVPILSYLSAKKNFAPWWLVLEGESSTPQVIDSTTILKTGISSMSIVSSVHQREFQDVLTLASFNTFEVGFEIVSVDKTELLESPISIHLYAQNIAK